MKSSKTYLLLSVIVAVLVLGVAYAAISNITLQVSGTVAATPDEGNFKVRFVAESGKKLSGTGSGTFTLVSNDENQISAELSAAGLTTKDQTATYTIDIENVSEGALSANLKLSTLTPTISGGTEEDPATNYFSVSASLDKEKIASSEKATLTVTITMLKTPTDDVIGNFTFNITAEPVNA